MPAQHTVRPDICIHQAGREHTQVAGSKVASAWCMRRSEQEQEAAQYQPRPDASGHWPRL